MVYTPFETAQLAPVFVWGNLAANEIVGRTLDFTHLTCGCGCPSFWGASFRILKKNGVVVVTARKMEF